MRVRCPRCGKEGTLYQDKRGYRYVVHWDPQLKRSKTCYIGPDETRGYKMGPLVVDKPMRGLGLKALEYIEQLLSHLDIDDFTTEELELALKHLKIISRLAGLMADKFSGVLSSEVSEKPMLNIGANVSKRRSKKKDTLLSQKAQQRGISNGRLKIKEAYKVYGVGAKRTTLYVTIPQAIARKLGISGGDMLISRLKDDGICYSLPTSELTINLREKAAHYRVVRVVEFGKKHLLRVSLPKQWTRKLGIEKGSEVVINLIDDTSFIVKAKR